MTFRVCINIIAEKNTRQNIHPGGCVSGHQYCISVNGWRKYTFKRCSSELANSDDLLCHEGKCLNSSFVFLTCSGSEHQSLLLQKSGRCCPKEALSHFPLHMSSASFLLLIPRAQEDRVAVTL
jgi:hypothetical protein